MKHLLIAVSLVLLAGLAGPTIDAVECPEEYSVCSDVPGKSCRFESGAQCDITDLGEQSCERPGDDFVCQLGQTVGVRNCDCKTRLQNQCCTEGECGYDCGSCEIQPGSQTLTCLGIACIGECPAQYCTGEGVGCVWTEACGAGGCCIYTCGQSIPSCTGFDPCPEHVCPGSC